VPEVEGREEGYEGAEEEDGDEGGDGAGLELEYPRSIDRYQYDYPPRGGGGVWKFTHPNPSLVSNVFLNIPSASSSSK